MAGSGFNLSGDNHSQNSLGSSGNAGINIGWPMSPDPIAAASAISTAANPWLIGGGIAAVLLLIFGFMHAAKK